MGAKMLPAARRRRRHRPPREVRQPVRGRQLRHDQGRRRVDLPLHPRQQRPAGHRRRPGHAGPGLPGRHRRGRDGQEGPGRRVHGRLWERRGHRPHLHFEIRQPAAAGQYQGVADRPVRVAPARATASQARSAGGCAAAPPAGRSRTCSPSAPWPATSPSSATGTATRSTSRSSYRGTAPGTCARPSHGAPPCGPSVRRRRRDTRCAATWTATAPTSRSRSSGPAGRVRTGFAAADLLELDDRLRPPRPTTRQVGDWDGDGADDLGGVPRPLLVPAHHRPAERHHGHQLRVRPQPGDRPVAGDWNGDGGDEPGIFRSGEWRLRQAAAPVAPTAQASSSSGRLANSRSPVEPPRPPARLRSACSVRRPTAEA